MASSSNSSSNSDSSAGLRHEAAVLYDQMYLAVQRSMCLLHFFEFDSFHTNLKVVCLTAVNAPNLNEDQLSNYFPFPPEKVRRDDWVHFDSWLMAGGKPLQGLCFDWSFYGRYIMLLELVKPAE